MEHDNNTRNNEEMIRGRREVTNEKAADWIWLKRNYMGEFHSLSFNQVWAKPGQDLLKTDVQTGQ